MDVIYSLIPGMMFFGLVFLAVLIYAVKKGQYEDMEGNASRILMDDDEEMMERPDDGKGGEENSEKPETRNGH
ncbi:MAG: cbb3-type cytochrome oxidase assembly protein CcoS [Gallionella sp.]|nr:cbb3-type cytochrome oxidase assembly protein CcoS [Gallionella sp.]